MTRETLSEYVERIKAVTDEQLVDDTNRQVWLSAFASNNPRAPAHWKVDALYDEAARREKPWLYQRGWNQAYASCGYTPSDSEIEAAKESAQ